MASSMGLFPKSYISLPKQFSKLQKHFKCCFVTASPSSPKSGSYVSVKASNNVVSNLAETTSPSSSTKRRESPLSGLESEMTGYILGKKKKATEVAHAVWKNVVRKGDVVVDATCGNGYDTLAMLRLVAEETGKGRVYAMDLQKDALESTSSLLGQSVNSEERELVELYAICHTKMEEIVPQGTSVRLVAFNLGYLPGGDKKIKTYSNTTLLALEAAKRILAPGGLISIVAYVGHSGGREEYEAVQSFACGLPFEDWVCCKLETLNRPLAPILVLLYKK